MNKLLVPIDSDNVSAQAISFAKTLLEEGQALSLLHVIRPLASSRVIHYVGRKVVEEILKEDAVAALTQTLQSVEQDLIPHTLEYEFGEPSQVIAKYTDEHDLVIMGTHKRGPITGFLLGSVSNAVLKKASCPVLLVPNGYEKSEEINTILVAVDGSETSHRAAQISMHLARKTNARCILVHVVTPPVPYSPEFADMVRKDREELVRTGEELLLEYENQFMHDQFPYMKKVAIGHPAQIINAVAEDEKADVIVLGYKGLNWMAEQIMGSVTYKLIHQSKIPLLIVK
jgi:nucleotide-binding universal stress UspA family protein